VNLRPRFHASVEESATNVQCRHISMLHCGDGQDREHGRNGHRRCSQILIEGLVLLIAPNNQPGLKLLKRSCIERSVHTSGDDTADERNPKDADPEQIPLQDAEGEGDDAAEGEYAMSLKSLVSYEQHSH
jgi:hypothetical protein